MPQKSTRFYWQPNPDATSSITPDKTPKHEALHTAVAIILGYEPQRIRLNKDGSGAALNLPFPHPGWHRAAIGLAPVLIDDLATTDVDYMSGVMPRSRGYAWGWLTRNKARIMRKASSIVKLMGRPGGTLLWNEDGSVEWRPRKKTRK